MPRLPVVPRWLPWVLAGAVAAVAAAAGGLLLAVRASTPALDGRLALPGLHAEATIARDAHGTAVVRAADRLDAARALGFVHAQERFFGMDLARRSAAGELAGLVGPAALARDEVRRAHRLRARLTARLATLPPSDRAVLQAYADGVNAGLAALPVRPWQYLLLRARPRAWTPVDSLLVEAEMYWMLQGPAVEAGLERALLRERVGDAVADWLEPAGGHWDAALDGSVEPPVPLPGPEVLDLRRGPPPHALAAGRPAPGEAPMVGSNEWAVNGSRTADGRAILANDMHLGLSTPGLWFRAQLEIGAGAGAVRAEGVTLPGLPVLVVGSNGQVAWGFTNAYGQWFDWMRVPDGVDDARVRQVRERIEVKGHPARSVTVTEFDGLPVRRLADGHAYALRWIGDDPRAYDLGLDRLLVARDLGQALRVAASSGLPEQNFLAADAGGHIGWTIAGRLWDRHDALAHAGRFVSVDAPAPALLAPLDAPRVVDPPSGQLWTANARTLGGDGLALLGDGGYDLGARAQQARDRLSARARQDEASVGAIQLDDEARFLKPWAARIAAALAGATDAQEVQARAVLAAWNGRADADQAGYRLVRGVRDHVLDALWTAWTQPLAGDVVTDPGHPLVRHRRFEYAVEEALDQRPAHLLPQPYATWDAFLRAQVDAAAREMSDAGRRPLARATWGEANASRVRHVLSRAVPALSRWLDMPSLPQSGADDMPRVALPAFGQSERLVVSPGHEDQGTLVVAGGQGGHPMSPDYGAGEATWAAGRSWPLLAGRGVHSLVLVP